MNSAGEAILNVEANQPLAFYTNNTERARITSGGDLLVGTTSTFGGRFNVQTSSGWSGWFRQTGGVGTSNLYVEYTGATPNNGTDYFVYCRDATAVRAYILSNGGLGNFQTNDVNLSDERVKTDVAPLGSMWDKLKAIEIVTFKYKDQTHDDDNIGVIAQQVEAVAPEFVDVDGWGETPEDGVPLKSIYTTDMYHAAIKALQEAMTRIEALEAEVAALKGAN